MSKEVTYVIKLVDDPANRTAMKNMEDAIKASMGRIEKDVQRLGVAANSAAKAAVGGGGRSSGGGGGGVSEYERQLSRLKSLGEKTLRDIAGTGNRVGQEIGKSIAVGSAKGFEAMQKQIDQVMGKALGGGATSGRNGAILGQVTTALKSLDDFANGINKTESQLERADRTFDRTFKKARNAIFGTANELFNMARGMTMLAMSGEDAEKVLSVLLKVQGAWDTLSGGARALIEIRETYKDVSESLAAYAKRQVLSADLTRMQADAAGRLVNYQQLLTTATQQSTNMTAQQAAQVQLLTGKVREASVEMQKMASSQSGVGIGGHFANLGGSLIGGVGGAMAGGYAEEGLTGSNSGVGSIFGGIGGSLAGAYLGNKIAGGGFSKLRGMFTGRALQAATIYRHNLMWGGIGRADFARLGGRILPSIGSIGLGGALALGGTVAGVGAAYGIGRSVNSGTGYNQGAVGDTATGIGWGLSKMGVGGFSGLGDAIGSLTDRFGTAGRIISGALADWLRAAEAAGKLADSHEALEKATKHSATLDSQVALKAHMMGMAMIGDAGGRTMRDARWGIEQESLARQIAYGGAMATALPSRGIARTKRELGREAALAGSLNGDSTVDSERLAASLARSKELYAQLKGYQDAMLTAVQSEASVRSQMNMESIQSAEKRLSLVRQEMGMFQTNEDRLNDAASRFAEMEKGDRAKVIQARKRQLAGGRLSREQRSLLNAIGLGDESEGVRRQNIADAAKDGFFGLFGSFERRSQRGSVDRLGRLAELDREAAGLGNNLPKEEYDRRALSIELRRRKIEEESRRAGLARAGGPTLADQRFGGLESGIQKQIEIRNMIEVQAKLDIVATAKEIARQVNLLSQQQLKDIAREVNSQIDKDKAERQANFDQKNKDIAARQVK